MAYAAVTSLMETLSLHFLQSQPGLPLDDLEAQIKNGNENLGLLQKILEIGNDDAGAMKYAEDEMREMGLDEASSSKGVHGISKKKKEKLIKSEKLQKLADLEVQIRDAKYENLGVLQQILEARIREMELDEEASSKQQLAWDTILLTSRLRTSLPWSDMSLIGMLPNLEVLKLINACEGPKWETSEGGFRQLKRLVIKDRRLEDWNAEGDHFPVLVNASICKRFLVVLWISPR